MPATSAIPAVSGLGEGDRDTHRRSSNVLSVAITDLTCGRAAEGVLSLIERQIDGNWQSVARSSSDCSGTISVDEGVNPGIYRLHLDADAYFACVGIVSLLPRVTVTFRVPEAGGHCLLRAYIAANSQFSVFVRADHPGS